uniref:Uncharacterized protein MANES_06G167200 n=1 Tax=Rhizophora mucronata TaxID=61149 RepID=A0A2P2JGE7_RHIMU
MFVHSLASLTTKPRSRDRATKTNNLESTVSFIFGPFCKFKRAQGISFFIIIFF